ncbi:MAG: thioredoxin domain-containing protein [Chloroflexota bacterium]
MSKRARTRPPAPAGGTARQSDKRPRSSPRRGERRPTGPGRIRAWALPSLFLVAGLSAVAILALTVTSPSSTGDVKAKRPILGDAAAPVLIREYGDFQCPSCGAFARGIAPQIRAAYIDTGLARLAWHDFAWIGPESRDAANAARCAGDQGQFWAFHDALYQNQAGENAGAFSRDRLKAFGDALGLEPTAFHACVDGDRYGAAVQADFAEVRRNGFNGTPTFVIGDQRIVGAQPFEVFAAAIDAALANR